MKLMSTLGRFPLTILATLSSLHCAGAQLMEGDDSAIPRFEDFKVRTTLRGRTEPAFIARPQASPGATDETPARFRVRIREAAKEGPDFAGDYALVRVSCGSDCNNLWIVNVQSGAFVSVPFIGVTRCVPLSAGPLFSYRLDSSLLIVKGSLEIPDGEASFKRAMRYVLLPIGVAPPEVGLFDDLSCKPSNAVTTVGRNLCFRAHRALLA